VPSATGSGTSSFGNNNDASQESIVLTTVWIDSSDYDQTPICTVILLVSGILIVIAAAVLCFINYRRSLRRLRTRIKLLESHYSGTMNSKSSAMVGGMTDAEQNNLLSYPENGSHANQYPMMMMMLPQQQAQPSLSMIPLRDEQVGTV